MRAALVALLALGCGDPAAEAELTRVPGAGGSAGKPAGGGAGEGQGGTKGEPEGGTAGSIVGTAGEPQQGGAGGSAAGTSSSGSSGQAGEQQGGTAGSDVGGKGASGAGPTDLLEPFTDPECSTATTYRVPVGECIVVRGRHVTSCGGDAFQGCSTHTNTGLACPGGQSCDGEYLLAHITAEPDKEFAVERRSAGTTQEPCAAQCN